MDKDMKFAYGLILSVIGIVMFYEVLGYYI